MGIDYPTLPEGWTSEVQGEHHTVIRSPFGCVTVCWGRGLDYRTRGFRSGLSSIGKLTSKGRYEGRGWMQRLVTDAVKWLQDVEASHKERQHKASKEPT